MKLSAWTIISIGFAIFLATLSWAFFHHYMPNQKETGYYNDLKGKLETEIAKRSAVNRRLEEAKRIVNEQATKWRGVVIQKTPPSSVAAGGIDITQNAWQLTVDSRKFRNNMQRAFNAQVRAGGVTVLNGPEIPDPSMEAPTILASYYNYPAIPFPVVMVDFGQVRVRGTYDQIAANVRSWSRMPNYLAVADGLQLTGTSPNLEGSYNLSMVAFIRGGMVFPGLPEGGGAPAGAGAPAGGGGLRGGPRGG